MRGHFRSRDEDGGNNIRSAVSENPMLHANLTDLCVVKAELLPNDVSHCGNRDIRLFVFFYSRDVDLDLMTFVYELDPYSLDMYRMSENKLPMSRLSRVIARQAEKQTDRHGINYARCFASLPMTRIKSFCRVIQKPRKIHQMTVLFRHSVTITVVVHNASTN